MNITLHAIWQCSSLWLWGETWDAAATTNIAPCTSAPFPHPLAASSQGLRIFLSSVLSRPEEVDAFEAAEIVLPLPFNSQGLLLSNQPVPADADLIPVRVPALKLAPAQAVEFFNSLPPSLPRGFADSLFYFQRLSKFVLDRVASRQFYPAVDKSSAHHWQGKWRLLVWQPGEIDWLQHLAQYIPPACCVVIENDQPQRLDPGQLIESFIAVTADALIRQAVARDPFFEQIQPRAKQPDSAPEIRWLASLLGSDSALSLREDQKPLFAEQSLSWITGLEHNQSAFSLHLCFALVEPAAGEDGWQIKLHLESLDDSAEKIDAATVWAMANEAPSILGRNQIHFREILISELARATEIWPALVAVQSPDSQFRLTLTPAEAHAFLHQWGPRLSESGFGVALPDWAMRRSASLALELSVRPLSQPGSLLDSLVNPAGRRPSSDSHQSDIAAGQLGLDTLLDFDWQIAVGDLRLTTEEFIALAETHSPLVRYRDQWVEIDAEAAQRAMEFLQSRGSGQMTLAQAMRTAYGAADADAGLPIRGLSAASWIEQLLQQIPDTHINSSTQPAGFDGTLRPYQLRGLDWLAFLNRMGIGACLADDMGLGKTIQLIALLLMERNRAAANPSIPLPGPTLLFAPTSVVGNWVREMQRFAKSLRVLVHHGPERLHGDAFTAAVAQNDLVITSYALAYRDMEDLARPKWHRVALDEAQKIKNPASASALAIRSIWSPHRVALTGTPIENHLSELWSIMDFLNPNLLGSSADFRERFAIPIEKQRDKDRAESLRNLIRPFVLRRTKSDPAIAGDLPEKMEMRVYCNLTPEQASLYQRITDEMIGHIDTATGIRRRGLILAALTRLKQICDHPALLSGETDNLDDRSGKCERIAEMLEEVLEEGDAALVFTQYRQMGHLLERILPQRLGAPVQFLHGGTLPAQRDAMIQRFQAPNSDIKIFILSLRAGGLGLNLTAANHVFHFDRWWNPAVEAQATDRAHRIGQTRKVQVHKFVCIGTMEERVDRMLTEKLALADQIVGTGDDWLTSLSTEELRKTLTLSADAIGGF